MITVAIFSTDPVLRCSLERMLREDPGVTVVGVADDPPALLRLIQQNHPNAVLAGALPPDQLSDWRMRHDRIAFVVLVERADLADGIEALRAGAAAILPRAAARTDILAAIKVAVGGLAVLPRGLLARLLDRAALTDAELAEELPDGDDAAGAKLTPRELEVLAAMADGASNKMIARRLGMSFHTAKFHVAAILAKLDADSRTEAVTRAAQLGLVML
jgi:DNA-binding NarL/FixJ family response regulator